MDSIIEKDKNQWTEVAIQSLCKDEQIKILPFPLTNNERWFEIDNLKDLIMAEKSFSKMTQKIKNKKRFIFDLDGTVYIGNKPIDGINKLISKIQEKGLSVEFLSNNSSKNKPEYVKKLNSMGIEIDSSQVILSTDASIMHLKQNNYKKGIHHWY